jgi:starch phosphorylase
VEIKLNWLFELHDGVLRTVSHTLSVLYGILYDRPVVGYNGSTINTLRLWPPPAPIISTSRVQQRQTSSALTETLAAQSLTRVLYPDDSSMDRACDRCCD